MLLNVVCADALGGLAGGEAKSAACRRFEAVCDESHWSADGSNMVVADLRSKFFSLFFFFCMGCSNCERLRTPSIIIEFRL